MLIRTSLVILFTCGCAEGVDVAIPDGGGGSPGHGGAGGGFVSCTPSCSDGIGRYCGDDGPVEFECDPLQGMQCDPDGCKGACALGELGPSYQGCDYYPTITMNPVWSGFSYAVGVANAGDEPAAITVTQGVFDVTTATVAAGSLEVIELPWVRSLKGAEFGEAYGPEPSLVAPSGAYRLRTTQPVAVYQFSPLEYELTPVPASCWDLPDLAQCLSQINDASLLLPANAWTRDYVGLTFESGVRFAGTMEITAAADDTEVEVFLGDGAELLPGGGLSVNGSGKAVLQAGDVLALHAPGGDQWLFGMPAPPPGPDLSGTRVQASKPVQVIAAHACAYVPYIVPYCDHLEESMLPIESWGSDYVVSAPLAPRSVAGAPQLVRLTALESGTVVEIDPPLVPSTTLSAGEILDIEEVTDDVHIHASAPILVAQLMQGSSTLPGATGLDDYGDPSLSLATPTDQFRRSYVILSPETYAESYLNVISSGAEILLDDTPIDTASYADVGASRFVVARIALASGGVHRLESEEPFGVVAYGYGIAASYMYPGGLELAHITPPPPH